MIKSGGAAPGGQLLRPDQWIWWPCEELAWVPVCLSHTASSSDEHVYESHPQWPPVRKYTDATREMFHSCLPVQTCSLAPDGNVNMAHMGVISEQSILHNLRVRYTRDNIYTFVGEILVSVNPYRLLPIYDSFTLLAYTKASDASGSEEYPPHVYYTAQRAYSRLVKQRKNQCVVINGESGAGKSEAAKLVIDFIVHCSMSVPNSDVRDVGIIAQCVARSGPVLEAFGNAATVRNDNSSRFGKLLQMDFDDRGCLTAAVTRHYLLEKSRVTHLAPGERNYHIFYQLLAGAPADLRAKLDLLDVPQYPYLVSATPVNADSFSDADNFNNLLDTFASMSVPAATIHNIFSLLATILRLGTLTFTTTGTDLSFADEKRVATVAGGLGASPEVFTHSLLVRRLHASRTSSFELPRTEQEAIDARDSLSTALYSALFAWVVNLVNEATYTSTPDALEILSGEKQSTSLVEDEAPRQQNQQRRHIFLLDIFGFENFASNSFEQLCINYANEKLQSYFNAYFFQAELADYEAEDVKIDGVLNFVDTKPVLDLFEGRGGIVGLVDEECSLKSGSDEQMLLKLHSLGAAKGNSSVYVKPRFASASFSIRHYADTVEYKTQGWLDKNKDAIHEDILRMVMLSSNTFVRELFKKTAAPACASSSVGRGASKSNSVLAKFKVSLSALMEQLHSGGAHFIRCIKPNSDKVANRFDSPFVLLQLRSAGLMTASAVRSKGYAYRFPFDEFFNLFKALAPEVTGKTPKEKAQALVTALQTPTGVCVGRTRVFCQQAVYDEFVARMLKKCGTGVLQLQSRVRGVLDRKRAARCRVVCARLTALLDPVNTFVTSREELVAVLEEAQQLDISGRIVLTKVQRLLEAQNAREKVVAKLVDAIQRRHKPTLEAAIHRAEAISLKSPEVSEARALLKDLQMVEVTIRNTKNMSSVPDPGPAPPSSKPSLSPKAPTTTPPSSTPSVDTPAVTAPSPTTPSAAPPSASPSVTPSNSLPANTLSQAITSSPVPPSHPVASPTGDPKAVATLPSNPAKPAQAGIPSAPTPTTSIVSTLPSVPAAPALADIPSASTTTTPSASATPTVDSAPSAAAARPQPALPSASVPTVDASASVEEDEGGRKETLRKKASIRPGQPIEVEVRQACSSCQCECFARSRWRAHMCMCQHDIQCHAVAVQPLPKAPPAPLVRQGSKLGFLRDEALLGNVPIGTPPKKTALGQGRVSRSSMESIEDTSRTPELIMEFIDKEMQYLADLRVLYQIYLCPLRPMAASEAARAGLGSAQSNGANNRKNNRNVLSGMFSAVTSAEPGNDAAMLDAQAIDVVFGSIEVIMHEHAKFAAHISDLAHPVSHAVFASIVSNMMKRMKGVYKRYFLQFDASLKTLESVCATKPLFAQWLAGRQKTTAAKGRDLKSLLALPHQQLDSYRSCLQDLVVGTNNTQASYITALDHVNAVGEAVESTHKQDDQMEQLRQMVQRFSRNSPFHADLVALGRWFVREGTVIFDGKKLVGLLLNDVLLLAKKSGSGFVVKACVLLPSARVMGEQKKGKLFQFLVIDAFAHSHIIGVESMDEQKAWISDITTAITSWKDTDSPQDAHAGEQAVAALHKGTPLIKHAVTKGAKSHSRMVSLTASGSELVWGDPDPTSFQTKSCPISEITEVKFGIHTKTLKGVASSVAEHLCFSVVTDRRTMDFTASDSASMSLWYLAFSHLFSRGGAGAGLQMGPACLAAFMARADLVGKSMMALR